MDYELTAKVFKALGDPKRVQIVDMLSCGERCACDLLEHFEFTQPTLSPSHESVNECRDCSSQKIRDMAQLFIECGEYESIIWCHSNNHSKHR